MSGRWLHFRECAFQGYLTEEPSGFFGPVTEDAVSRWQVTFCPSPDTRVFAVARCLCAPGSPSPPCLACLRACRPPITCRLRGEPTDSRRGPSTPRNSSFPPSSSSEVQKHRQRCRHKNSLFCNPLDRFLFPEISQSVARTSQLRRLCLCY